MKIHIAAAHLSTLTRFKSTILASINERQCTMGEKRQSQTDERYDASIYDTSHLRELYAPVEDIGFLLELADHIHLNAGRTSLDNFEPHGAYMDIHRPVENTTSIDDYYGKWLIPLLDPYIDRAIHQKIEHVKIVLVSHGLADAKDFEA